VKIPIIGVGGIMDYADAVEFLYAGARCIQVGTAVMYQGLDVFQRIANGMAVFMKDKEFHSVDEMVGLAHQD
jgi:dihydroorotate dehydrogenase (NAD+) catalytic subunit